MPQITYCRREENKNGESTYGFIFKNKTLALPLRQSRGEEMHLG